MSTSKLDISQEKLPYGTFSNPLQSIETGQSTESSSNLKPEIQVNDNAGVPVRELVEVSINPDSDVEMDFGDSEKLPLVDKVASESLSSKKDGDVDKIPRRDSKNPVQAFFLQYRGIFLALCTSVSISLAAFLTKFILREGYSVTVCLFWRSPLVLAVGVLQILYHRVWQNKMIFDTLWPCDKADNRKTIFLLFLGRGLIAPAAIVTQFMAFSYIELGDAQTIIYSNAVFVTFFAHFLLGESWGIVPLLAAFFTAVGVMIISKPPFITGSKTGFSSDRLSGLLLAICSMLLNVFVFIILRFLRHVNSSISVFVMGFVTMILGLAMSIGFNEFEIPREDLHIAAFFGLASLTSIGMITFILALQYEEAGLVALVRCADVIFSFLWQILLGVYPDKYSLSGAAIVLLCIFVVFFRKYLGNLPPEHYLAKKLWFFLK